MAGWAGVYDGLDATGNVLGTIPLAANYHNGGCLGDPTGDFCHWDPVGVAFGGVAKSVSFACSANQVGFDNISLGTDVPVPGVPEPSTIKLLGSALLAILGIRRRVRA